MSDLKTQLPDGRLVSIAPDAVDRLCCGVIVLDPVSVFDNPDVAAATAEVGRVLQQKHEGLLPSQIEGLTEARNLYKSFNMDPSRHRPSSEALLRRVMKGKDLYSISNAVDSCNLACLKFLLPVGMYDLNLVAGDVVLRSGSSGESYPGIRKGDVNLDGRLGLFDQDGPFGSPTSDSARTCVSINTNRVLAVIMATNAFPMAEMDSAVNTFADLFSEHCRGLEIHRAILGGSQ
jgi:DNA/RNA-binding domain of Phe-tRNA-synthetase-like protein